MIKRQFPTAAQGNAVFLFAVVITWVSSIFLQPRLGLGTNLWINEYVWILLPPLLLTRLQGWSVEEVYRFKTTSRRNKLISFLSGICLWLVAVYVGTVIRIFLDARLGSLPAEAQFSPSVYQTLLTLLGMVILAPICEEILFRGLIQRAYEGYGKKRALVIAAFLFSSYHVLNGLSEVLPVSILGLGMGYLLYKTDSIASSMVFHAACNLSAIFLGGVGGLTRLQAIPAWFHLAVVGSLGVTWFLFRGLQGTPAEERSAASQAGGMSAAGAITLVLAALFLLAMGALEAAVRLRLITP